MYLIYSYNASGFTNDWRLFRLLCKRQQNTVLFALAGVVFGAIVADNEKWFGDDWGYLILLCVLLNLVRFFLVFSFYPILSRIGLKSSWREAVFISFGGLRGAVGIALALALEAEVWHETEEGNPARTWTATLL